MKKALVVMLAALLVAGAVGLVGCGKTSVKVDTKKGELEVETDKGGVKVETGVPSEAELGVPIYPGAEGVKNAAGSVTEGDKTYSAAQFLTEDAVSKVLDWYKNELKGEPGFIDMSTAEGGILSFQAGSEIKTVTIGPGQVDQKGKTVIIVSSGTGTMPQLNQ